MIKVIGKQGCEGCKTTKELLENEGIEFEYYDLDALNNEERREYIRIAREANQAFFPIIFKDNELVSIPDYKNGKYLEGVKRYKAIKRDKTVVGFNKLKIENAIIKSMAETEKGVDKSLAQQIANEIFVNCKTLDKTPTVEEIQDKAEELLAFYGRFDASRRYILYREERNKLRGKTTYSKYKHLSDNFLSKYKHKQDPFPTELGKFVYYRTYSRPIPEENRRERWWETVARVVDFSSTLEVNAMKRQGLIVDEVTLNRIKKEAEEIFNMMYNLKLFPSGRSLWVGNTKSSYEYPLSNFNCSFVAIDSLKKFSEIFFVLMLGTGAGLSVERKYVSKLPKINSSIEIIHKDYTPVQKHLRNEHTELTMKTPSVLELIIGDSKFGWSRAMELYLDIVSSKQYKDIDFVLINYDNVRPAGEILKTFGGYELATLL